MKKDFTQAAAMQFISKEQKEIKRRRKNENVIKGNYAIKLEKSETKTKRFNMILKPSLYNNLKEIAKQLNISINDLAHQVLADFIEKQR
jgi:predicted HicB family RNase H-like nuclease